MRLDPLAAARRVIGGAREPSATPPRRRRRRADAVQTIVPELDPAAPSQRLSLDRLDAARDRLRAAIPPRPDDE